MKKTGMFGDGEGYLPGYVWWIASHSFWMKHSESFLTCIFKEIKGVFV